MSFLQKLTTVATLWLGARLVMSGALTVGELVGFNLIAARIAQPVLRLAQCWQELQQAGVSLKRLGTLMHALPEPERTASHGQQPPLAGQIAFDSVQFRYRPQGPDLLRGLSFECRRGTVLAIVGPSGSGKSTIAGLLQRLHVPQGGRILLDGQNLALLDPQWLRRQIGVVLQENRLFNRSVRDSRRGDLGTRLRHRTDHQPEPAADCARQNSAVDCPSPECGVSGRSHSGAR
jgi:subfamily B ATP-binding cassette protein HlyB/CyaB